MNKLGNFELMCQVAQNLVNGDDTKTVVDISDWRILDACLGSVCIVNDANGYRDDQTIYNVDFTAKNHSGLGFTYHEERIDEEEIISDMTFSIEVDKEYETGDVIEYDLVYTITKDQLNSYGFHYPVLDECE